MGQIYFLGAGLILESTLFPMPDTEGISMKGKRKIDVELDD
jgi:hypothetical protein